MNITVCKFALPTPQIFHLTLICPFTYVDTHNRGLVSRQHHYLWPPWEAS